MQVSIGNMLQARLLRYPCTFLFLCVSETGYRYQVALILDGIFPGEINLGFSTPLRSAQSQRVRLFCHWSLFTETGSRVVQASLKLTM